MKAWETDETFLARWLNDQLTQEELQAFEASPEYESYVATAKALQPFEVAPFDQEAALGQLMERVQKHKTQNKSATTIPLYRRWYFATAAAVVLILLAFVWLQSGGEAAQTELFAENREQLRLPDGSLIELQKGSRVRYPKKEWEENRAVYLEGEAYFEVEKGERFDIYLKQGKVSVLGTSFLISERADTLSVVCFTGKVQVEAFGASQILEKGESVLTIKDQSPQLLTTVLPQPIWLAENIKLEDVSLGLVVQQIEELYQIQIEGEFDPELRFNPIFPVNDLNTALSQVFGPFSIEYQLDTSRNVVVILP